MLGLLVGNLALPQFFGSPSVDRPLPQTLSSALQENPKLLEPLSRLTESQGLPELASMVGEIVSATDGGTPEDADEEWRAIHDPGWPFLRWVMSSKSVTIRMEDLVKHHELNRALAYVPPEKRDQLSAFVTAFRPLLEHAYQMNSQHHSIRCFAATTTALTSGL